MQTNTKSNAVALSAPTADELARLDAWWRAANYLSVGQIYLFDNPLLQEPLKLEHVKPRLLGHWGTTPGLNFIYAHLNPATDGAVPPILHLNGYKIANPTLLARIPHAELESLLTGYGYHPYIRRGRGAGGDAPGDGRDAGRGDRGHPRDPARGAWARTHTPMAACCSRTCACRTSATMPWRCRGPARSRPRPRASWACSCAT